MSNKYYDPDKSLKGPFFVCTKQSRFRKIMEDDKIRLMRIMLTAGQHAMQVKQET